MITSAIEVAGLTFHNGPTIVLDRVDLTVPQKAIVAIAGRANVGKSVLLRILLRQLVHQTGDVVVLGLRVQDQVRAVRRQTTWVEHSGVLEPHLTVRQNLHLILRLSRCPLPNRVVLDKALRESDLPDRVFDQPAGHLSASETLAVWLAVARLRQTPLLLLDDPTAQLSGAESARAVVLIRELSATGTTVLLTTRDPRFAENVARAVHVLEGGRLSDGRVSPRGPSLQGVAEFVASLR